MTMPIKWELLIYNKRDGQRGLFSEPIVTTMPGGYWYSYVVLPFRSVQ